MEREIKFRVWDNSDYMSKPFRLKDVNAWIEFANDAIVMQYTGLKDKKGVEIYEGDIIKSKMGFIGKIVYGTHAYLTKTDRYEGTGWLFIAVVNGHTEFLDRELCQGEIIGNIHQNPELI